jgi:hypothetical protein
MAQIRVSDETYARLVRIYLCDLFQKNWGDDVILPDMSPKRRH